MIKICGKSVILIIVSDEQLIISIIAGSIILMAAIGGIILNIYFFFKAKQQRNKFVRILLLIFLIIISVFVYQDLKKNYYFYINNIYVQGRIIQFCKTDRNEEGVYFEYLINGKIYTNCNSFFPFPKDSIKIHTIYPVRVNKLYPKDGRILLK